MNLIHIFGQTKLCRSDLQGIQLISVYKRRDKYINQNTNIPVNINSYIVNNLPSFNQGEEFKQTKPKFIITSGTMLSFNGKLNIFEFNSGDCISVMDGFVDIDFTMNFS